MIPFNFYKQTLFPKRGGKKGPIGTHQHESSNK
jgi:hypothetical protein